MSAAPVRVKSAPRVPYAVSNCMRGGAAERTVIMAALSDYTPVMQLAELAVGRMRSCTLAGGEIVVCRTREGVFALDNICTHAEARLCEGRLRAMRLVCPLHGGSFDVRDGRVLRPPAERPLTTHPVRIVDGVIEVALSRSDVR